MKKLWLILLALLSGCASFDKPEMSVLSSQEDSMLDCRNLLADYEAYSYLDDQARATVRKNVRRQWVLTRNSCEQLRLALMYSLGNGEQTARALKLVEELLESGALVQHLQAQRLALLLRDRLNSERRQLLQMLELRHLLRKEQSRNRIYAGELESLRSQLQQLKQIEQNINEKEQSLIPSAADPLAPGAAPHPGGG
ncbi:hypothetical protein [Thiolapillus brandeum]|uniref:Lipoprotein n=1 Tax=Thiolapillus brandeum TaxID=1076588 RepID=A0A7U6GL00_9GAMM|nr:hypothetical protein [Thiolapillus brandeum]BAO45545.1 hypothetical protein TBH_C2639 [Thiolapillus brandeum]